MKKGFTLVEMLVVIAILSVVGVLILTIFTRTLRGTNKSQIISAIKQNGQSVLEILDKSIRGADHLVCVSSEPNDDTIVLEKEGTYTRFRFVLPQSIVAAPQSCLVNGCIISDNPVPESDESDPRLFINSVCASSDPMDKSAVLSDTNSQTGVKVISGSFKQDSEAGFKDIVTIKFVLGPGVDAPKAVAGQIDPVTFQTTIQLR